MKLSSDSVSKDSVKKHIESWQHKEAICLETKSLFGAEAYEKNVLIYYMLLSILSFQ